MTYLDDASSACVHDLRRTGFLLAVMLPDSITHQRTEDTPCELRDAAH